MVFLPKNKKRLNSPIRNTSGIYQIRTKVNKLQVSFPKLRMDTSHHQKTTYKFQVIYLCLAPVRSPLWLFIDSASKYRVEVGFMFAKKRLRLEMQKSIQMSKQTSLQIYKVYKTIKRVTYTWIMCKGTFIESSSFCLTSQKFG